MNSLLKKIKLLFAALLFAFTAKAQHSCTTATTFGYPIDQTVTGCTDSVYWFRVTFKVISNNKSIKIGKFVVMQ